MCILCVVQNWSRRVATMLPWLVIPLIGLWALSQLLPPDYRFEVTSPRLACVFVLLITLFWYEVLMPKLSLWRARRKTRLRERERLEAMELQKLRKTATRRCRNCYTQYRDQNPPGGKFMCSYCGHVSKRPVLEITGATSSGVANSGIGRVFNGKVWSENGWVCGQDWPENGNWTAPSFAGKTNFLQRKVFFGGDNRCMPERQPYTGIFVFSRLLSYFFLSMGWTWRKLFGAGSSNDGGTPYMEKRSMLSRTDENGVNCHESRIEKARRKAEEKRQARIERELLEEEERKQRLEVARLVEERRRLRDEQLPAQKKCEECSTPVRGRGNRREAERKHREKRKEKDSVSSKSNSDAEDLERKSYMENDRKCEFDKKRDLERKDIQKIPPESVTVSSSDLGHTGKRTMHTFTKFNDPSTRYLGSTKGSFLSSSKALSGVHFFGKPVHNSAMGTKANKPSYFGDLHSVKRREVLSSQHMSGKAANADENTTVVSSIPPVGSVIQPQPPVQKKSWQQLFTCPPTATSFSNSDNATGQQSQCESFQLEAEHLKLPHQEPVNYHLSEPIQFGFSMPQDVCPFSSPGSSSSGPASESVASLVGGPAYVSEEAEHFYDPCYVPDPVSLLGPVSESLDDFPLEPGTAFRTNTRTELTEIPHIIKNTYATSVVIRPAPIESPLSSLRVSDERQGKSSQIQCPNRSQDEHALLLDESSNSYEHGTWQMWDTPSLGRDGLGFVGSPGSWLLPVGPNEPNQKGSLHQSPHETMVSSFTSENQDGNGHSQISCFGSYHGGRSFSPLEHVSSGNAVWLDKTLSKPFPGYIQDPFTPDEPQKDALQHLEAGSNQSKSASIHMFEPSCANVWSKSDWAIPIEVEDDAENSPAHGTPHIGGLFSNPNAESLWSYSVTGGDISPPLLLGRGKK